LFFNGYLHIFWQLFKVVFDFNRNNFIFQFKFTEIFDDILNIHEEFYQYTHPNTVALKYSTLCY